MARDTLAELLGILRLERIEENIFRGPSQDLGWGAVFGGQVLGQALSAAAQTVDAERAVHSLHAYFLRQGNAHKPIVYTVDPIRDGRSFATRRVVAVQDGKAIFSLAASFQVEEPGLEHQAEQMPEAPDPETLHPEDELARRYFERLPPAVQAKIPERMRERATSPRPIDVRPVSPRDPVRPPAEPAPRQVWFKANGELPDDPAVHRYLLAYASDFHFLVTAMQPHGVSWMTPGMQVASLDHAMWFHRPFRLDDWLLYDIDGPFTGNARGLVRGRFFDRQGRLVASTAQEGLVRDRRG